jgi:hypothetical protein
MDIPTRWAPLLVSGLRDAVTYNQELLRSQTLRNREDYEEHLMLLSQFYEFVKEEYRKIEGEAGIPLARLLGEK